MSNFVKQILQKKRGLTYLPSGQKFGRAALLDVRRSRETEPAGWTTGTQFESWSASTLPTTIGTIDFYKEAESLVSSSIFLTIYAIVKE